MNTISLDDQIESLLDIAEEMFRAGRPGAAQVCIDATRIIKYVKHQRGEARRRGHMTRKQQQPREDAR